MFQDLLLSLLVMLVLLVMVLIGVAFFTLFERKILGYIHIRKGPNKVGYSGLLQPFSDAVKLFTKEQSSPLVSNLILFYLCPLMNFIFSLLLWVSIPFYSVNFSFSFSILFMLCVSSLGVYTIMLAGWSSNSSYALLGSLRSVAQIISYEVSLVLILLSFLFLVLSFDFKDFIKFQESSWFLFVMFPLSMMLFVSFLAETNRSPFDFAEGESELVSGFNVEYSSGLFAMIFLAEYASILFMSMICTFLFMGADLMSIYYYLKLGIIMFFWVWVRGTLPRYRYDKLMSLAWKSYLPVALNLLLLYFSIIMYCMYNIM
uniref:NADH-ubiquinone oxidoreductase chain 1 n=1 Tax=Hylastes attenuatus TaxID=471226 RepID=A0A343A6J6_9CUCU|nr:NADH dehydrogenase subunit 1 [Hylastes attenuatus]AOY40188.1 NADH dehydrogenase subunit 1 [Hylastes attenuatus]